MAARFFVVGGVDTNWGTIGNWSLTSNGAGGQAVPTAADDVTLDASSGSACVLDTSARVAKTLVTTAYVGSLTFNQQLSVSGSVTIGATTTFAGATTNRLRMITTGTWTSAVTIPQNIEIGGTTTFTCTLATAITTSGDLFLTNTTSTPFAGTFLLSAANATISGSQTVTLVNDVQITGNTTCADANIVNGSGFNWGTGGQTLTGQWSGTALVLFNGTGTLQGAAIMASGITINTAGTLTISGTIAWSSGAVNKTFTYVAGTVVTTGSTLLIANPAHLDTNGITWNAISYGGGSTLTIDSPLQCATFTDTAAGIIEINGLLTGTTLTLPNAAVTFTGTAGWTFGTFTNTTITATRIWTFQTGITYRVLTAMVMAHAAAQTVRFTWTSSHASTKAIFILGPGATQDIGFVDPTRIDSSLGQTLYTHHGVITDCLNWISAYRVNAPWVRPVYQLGI